MGKLNEVIEKVTTSVEKVHQEIAHKPIEVVESIVPNLALTKKVGEVQAKIIGGVYGAIRSVNKAVATLAEEKKAPAAKPQPAAEPAKAAPGPVAQS
ncbi:MAG TPA: hypothetical protein VI356_09945 [Myxococcales bacterium]